MDDLDVMCLSCGHQDLAHVDDGTFCRAAEDCDCTNSPTLIHSVAISGLLERMKEMEARADMPVRDGHPLWTPGAP
jgi:hypothetical protein